MKVSASLMVLVASCEAFVVQDGVRRYVTQLFNYRPTKWTPQQGATGSTGWSGGGVSVAPPPPAAAPAAGFAMNDLAKQWASMNSGSSPAPPAYAPAPAPQSFAGASSGGPKSYSTTRWNPRTGSNPMSMSSSSVGTWSPPVNGVGASPVMSAPSSYQPAPVAPPAAAPQAYASAGRGGPKSYSTTRWNPRTGSNPMGMSSSSVGTWSPPVTGGGASPVMSAPSSYQPAPVAPPAAAPQAYASAGRGSPKSYSTTRWNPRTGSNPMGMSSSSVGTWSPPVTGGGASPVMSAPSSYQPAPVAPPAAAPQAYASAGRGSPKSYSTTRWNPRTGSNPMGMSSSSVGTWSPPVTNAGASSSYQAASVPAPAPAPAGPSMNDLAKSWASMNTDRDGASVPSFKQPVASPPPAPASSFARSSGGPKNMYSVSKWNPRSGSSPGAMSSSSPGQWTPGAAAASSSAPPKKAAASDPMADLAKQWAAMNSS